MLVAGVILTASIAAAMYLFRIGAQNLERVNNSNLVSSKLPQALSLLRGLDLNTLQGSEDLGDGVSLVWGAKLLEELKRAPSNVDVRGRILTGGYEMYLYEVNFSLEYQDRLKREYSIHVFKSNPLQSASASPF